MGVKKAGTNISLSLSLSLSLYIYISNTYRPKTAHIEVHAVF